jgi:hypothetical protein
MKNELKYIELKSGYSDDGPAWIGKVEFSKTGKTVYFNGHSFRGNGHGGCIDIETRLVYWITGIKKDGQNRQWAGKGKIMIDKIVVDEYLKIIDKKNLDLNKFEIIEISTTDKNKFSKIENTPLETDNIIDNFPDLKELGEEQLENLIRRLRTYEYYTNPINGRKFVTIKINEAEFMLSKLKTEKEQNAR